MIPGGLGMAALWLAGISVLLFIAAAALGGVAGELAPLWALR
jgi:hypothetical protein